MSMKFYFLNYFMFLQIKLNIGKLIHWKSCAQVSFRSKILQASSLIVKHKWVEIS